MVWKKRTKNHFPSSDSVYIAVGKAVCFQRRLIYVTDRGTGHWAPPWRRGHACMTGSILPRAQHERGSFLKPLIHSQIHREHLLCVLA